MATNNAINLGRNSFSAYLSATIGNVTGNGFDYTVICDIAEINEGSSYNTGTGVYTVPKTGNFYFGFNCSCTNVGVGMVNGVIWVEKNATEYYITYNNPFVIVGGSGSLIYSGSIIIPCAAADAITFHYLIAGATKVAGIGQDHTRVFGCQLL